MIFSRAVHLLQDRLGARLVVGVLLCVLAIGTAAGIFVFRSEKELLEAQMDAHGASITEAAAIFCVEPFLDLDWPVIESYAETLAQDRNEIVFVAVTREDGLKVAEAPENASRGSDGSFRRYTASILAPDGRPLGEVAIGISSRRPNAIIAERNVTLLAYSVTSSGVLVALLWFLLKRWLGDRLRRVDAAARRLATGDLEQPVLLPGSDELARLAATLDQMRSNLRRLREEIIAQNDELRKLDRMKREFLATVSHELRTPLNGVMGMIELVATGRLSPEQAERLRIARESADELLRLIDDLLDFSRIESGNVTLEQTSFAVRLLVQDVMESFSEAATRQGIEWSWHVAPDVPTSVTGDQGRLRQVLLNLLANALKFTPRGRTALRVTTNRTMGDRRLLRFDVEDTGIGIALELQSRLFQPFAQADGSMTRDHGGSGLGLAIAKRLVDLMGGSIHATSTPGSGSCFTVLVPVTVAHPEAAAAAPLRAPTPPPFAAVAPSIRAAPGNDPAAAADGEGVPPSDMRVLVVEDNIVNLKVAVGMLRRRGIRPDTASTGAEAVDACRVKPYELILMDLQMPVMDGLEATRSIRRMPPPEGVRPTIVAFTANALDEDRRRCDAAGFDEFIAKPMRFEDLDSLFSRLATATRS